MTSRGHGFAERLVIKKQNHTTSSFDNILNVHFAVVFVKIDIILFWMLVTDRIPHLEFHLTLIGPGIQTVGLWILAFVY